MLVRQYPWGIGFSDWLSWITIKQDAHFVGKIPATDAYKLYGIFSDAAHETYAQTYKEMKQSTNSGLPQE